MERPRRHACRFALLLAGGILWATPARPFEDCNENGMDDRAEVDAGITPDCDGDLVPDDCAVALPPVGFRRAGEVEIAEEAWFTTTGDFDGDGMTDVAVLTAGRRLFVFPQAVAGSFGAGLVFDVADPVFFQPANRPLAVADLDGDGDDDLVVVTTDRTFVVEHTGGALVEGRRIEGISQGSQVFLSDLDGDRLLDIVVGSRRGVVSMASGRSDGSFEAPLEYAGPPEVFSVLAVADFDGDGDVDVFGEGRGDLVLLVNDGKAVFEGRVLPSAFRHVKIVAGDVDGDGDVDLVGSSDGQELWFVENVGKHQFAGEVVGSGIRHPSPLELEDVDRDGDLDILFLAPGPEPGTGRDFSILVNRGDAGFAMRPAPLGVTFDRLVTSDLDADGGADLLVRSDFTTVVYKSGEPYSLVDCDGNGSIDSCEGADPDCDRDGIDDRCALLAGIGRDCNRNGVPDRRCDFAAGVEDCNRNFVPDSCDVAAGDSLDLNADGVPDECEVDCNGNGVLDWREPERPDCNRNGIPDECDLAPALAYPDETPLPPVEAGVEATGKAALDADGDGDLDVAATFPGAVRVYINRGSRVFEALDPILIGSNPRHIAAGDVDRDGRADIVTANSLGTQFVDNVSFLYGSADGLFDAPRNVAAGRIPLALELEDFTGDGLLDVVTLNDVPPRLLLLVNRGNRRFDPGLEILTGDLLPVTMFAKDLDGDRLADLLIGTTRRQLVLLTNTGAGSFEPRTVQELAAGGLPAGMTAADFDADGDLDVAVVETYNRKFGAPGIGDRLTFFVNDRGFVKRMALPVGPLVDQVSAGDLDDDGDVDLAASGRFTGTLEVFLNHGAGSFAGPLPVDLPSFVAAPLVAVLDDDTRPDWVATTRDGLSVFFHSLAPRAFDCDANGVPDECDPDCDRNGRPDACDVVESDCNANGAPDPCDVASGFSEDCDENGVPDECDPDCNSNGFNDACEFEPQIIYTVTHRLDIIGRRAIHGDVDGDGDPDLVTLSRAPPALSVLRNPGDGKLELLEEYPLEAPPAGVDLADLDGDGDLDVVLGNEGTDIWVLRNTGGGRLGAVESHAAGERPFDVKAVDLDGDGVLEIAVATIDPPVEALEGAPHSLKVLRRDAGGGFVEHRSFAVGFCPSVLVAADLDTDGDTDLAVGGNGFCEGAGGAALTILTNEGDGTLASALMPVSASFFGENLNLISADIDVDGLPDLVSASVFYRNTGDATFAPPVIHGGSGAFVAATDFAGDGVPDLAFARPRGRPPSMMFVANVGGVLSRARSFMIEENRPPNAISSADFDGDGDEDLAVLSINYRAVFLLRNDSVGPLSVDRNHNGVPDECEATPFHRGDSSGDGRVDLTDGIVVLRHLFASGPPPGCLEAGDFDNSGDLRLTDGAAVFQYLFRAGPPPAPPGPPPLACGIDLDPPGSSRDLGCAVYDGCRGR